MEIQFDKEADRFINKLLNHFQQNYEISHDVTVGDFCFPALAEFHIMEEKTFFGFKANLQSKEANEYLFFLSMENFPLELSSGIDSLVDAIEKQFLNFHENLAFTLFSIVFVTTELEKASIKQIKRYNRRRSYRSAWSILRIVVVEMNNNRITCNRDGTDLGQIIKKQVI